MEGAEAVAEEAAEARHHSALTTITTITTTSRRTRPPGRRPCSCSAPTTPSAGTPGSSSNGHILLKHSIRRNIANIIAYIFISE